MKYYKIVISAAFIFICFSQLSCKKYLDYKSDKSFVIPNSVKQLQGLMDGPNMVAEYYVPSEIASDNYYFAFADWSSIANLDQRITYIWDGQADLESDWRFSYARVFSANVALAVLDTLIDNQSTQQEFNNVRGTALFYRAMEFFNTAQIFAPQYSSASATTGLGIPLRTSPNIDEVSVRSSVQETYDRIISDLKVAIPLLPSIQSDSIYKTRPTKAAVYALLARTYLVMGKYEDALKYSDSCLQIENSLYKFRDFGTIGNTANPFKSFNKETIFYAQARSFSRFTAGKVDSLLYASYSTNDIRKSAYFRSNGDGTYRFKGNYTGSSSNSILFSGIATDEVYLIRAECNARLGNTSAAMNDLNFLLETRWKAGTFVPYTAGNSTEALNKILAERRKELAFRPNLRWSDLRRLNLDNVFAITIKRNLNGQIYELPPNDFRYTFLIPSSVVQISGIQQNPR